MRIGGLALLAGLGLASSAGAEAPPPAPRSGAGGQEEPAGGLVTVELRVISTGPGSEVTVDRGGSDSLEEGDLVLFHPRQGNVVSGAVSAVNRRSAVVELHDTGTVPATGSPTSA